MNFENFHLKLNNNLLQKNVIFLNYLITKSVKYKVKIKIRLK